MLKKVCDKCGADASETNYTFPREVYAVGGRGNVKILVLDGVTVPQTTHLCKDHELELAHLFELYLKKN